METIHFFAGGNTAQGFCSHFEDIVPPSERKRMFYIKGGPGVGKSTFMRRVGEAAQQAGHVVWYFHCSSDPDSLDGVCLPKRGLALMDGTAPHVYDPVTPGARDTLLSLGDFLDEAALRQDAQAIGEVQRAISARFARCYRYLAAAEQVRRAGAAGHEDEACARALAEEWSRTLPKRGGMGTVRTLFASAYTPKGLTSLLDSMGQARRVTLECPFGLHATQTLRTLGQLASARGLDVVLLADALCPDELAHVAIPEHGLLFATGQRAPGQEGEWLPPERAFVCPETADPEQRFDQNAFELLAQRAVEQLAAAKRLHDELESYYVRRMDFDRWEAMLERVKAEVV